MTLQSIDRLDICMAVYRAAIAAVQPQLQLQPRLMFPSCGINFSLRGYFEY